MDPSKPMPPETARKRVSLLLSFLLSLFASMLALLLVLQYTLLNEGFLRARMQESQYAAHLLETLDMEFASYGDASGFDEAFFTSVVSLERVQNDLNQEVARLYGDTGAQLDVVGFETHLYHKLLENVKARELEVNEQTESALQYLAQSCAEVYASTVGFPLLSTLAPMLHKLQAVSLAGLGAALLLLTGAIVLLMRVNPSRRRRLRYLLYADGGAMLMLLAPALVILFSGKIERVGILNKALYGLVTAYAVHTVFYLLAAAAAFALLWIGLFFLRRHYFKKADEAHERHRERKRRREEVRRSLQEKPF